MSSKQGSDSMRMWGSIHKFYRLQAGLSHADVAQYVGYSPSLVISIERGTRMPSPNYVVKSDEVTKARGALLKAAEHLSRTRYPAWFEEYAVEEQRARSLRTYSTHVLHGLLQTEEYARAVFTYRIPALEPEEIDTGVEARLRRQALLTRRPVCTLSFVIEEPVLRRLVCEPDAMKRQLEHLVQASEMRNVAIQVMPLGYGQHSGLSGPMTLLETPDHKWLGYLETQDVGQLIDDADKVSVLQERYSMIRSQALNVRDSVDFIKQLAGEL
jgi:transcriptional regulator with XRE-family HTH domain